MCKTTADLIDILLFRYANEDFYKNKMGYVVGIGSWILIAMIIYGIILIIKGAIAIYA